MENENKWEFDYSGLYGSNGGQASSAESGYVNVGSSGTNAANQYEQAEASQAASGWSYTAPAGGSVPPRQPQAKPAREKKPFHLGGAAKTVLAVALCGAVGFGGGWAGAAVQQRTGGNRVLVQTVERPEGTQVGTSTGGSDLSFAEVAAMVNPSVVVITTEQLVSTGNWFGMSSVQSGAGSGVVMSADGYIITCAHVVDGASSIIVTIDEKDYTATLVGADVDSDIAVVKVEGTGFVPVVIADSDGLAVGEGVVAVGNPLGVLGGTVTNGIISALNRNVTVGGRSMNLVQTNASVSPGNSGGGLFNMAGELIGIVNAKSSSSDAEGLGFAIPSNTALQVATDLIENGYVTGRPALGITVITIDTAEMASRYGVNAYGVYVMNVNKGSGAERAGLQTGDRIVSINDTEVSVSNDLTDELEHCSVGDVVTLVIAREGKMHSMDVTLGEKNTAAQQQNGSAGGGRG